MGVKITDVKITIDMTWGNVMNLKDWNTVKISNPDWDIIKKSTLVGRPINIEVQVTDSTWGAVKQLIQSWNNIKTKFASWLDIKNW
jgi:hypothetical protein